MKKTLTLTIVLIVGAMISFYSCKKESSKIPNPTTVVQPTADSIDVKDNRLVFASVNVYENFINSSSDKTDATTSRIGQSMKTTKDTLIDDEFLASILNDKNIIQIGSSAYKIDMSDEKVYVLDQINDVNLKLLENKDTSTNIIKALPISEDVLYPEDIDAVSASNMKKSKCLESKARPRNSDNKEPVAGKKHNQWPVFADTYQNDNHPTDSGYFKLRPKCEHKYKQFAIFFILKTEFHYDYKNAHLIAGIIPHWSNAHTLITLNIDYKFKERNKNCGKTFGEKTNKLSITNKDFYGGDCTNKIVYKVYHGTRALTKYSLKSDYDFSVSGCTNTTGGDGSTSPQINPISWGY